MYYEASTHTVKIDQFLSVFVLGIRYSTHEKYNVNYF